jgi:hypothetical protein
LSDDAHVVIHPSTAQVDKKQSKVLEEDSHPWQHDLIKPPVTERYGTAL